MTFALTLAPVWAAPVLLAIAALGCATPVPLSELARLGDDLEQCTPAVVPAGAELPCGAPGIPFLTSEREYLDCFGGMLFSMGRHHHHHASADSGQGTESGQAMPLVAELEEFLLSVYQGGGEAGLFGLRLSNDQAAESAASHLRLRGSEGSKVHVKGTLVVQVWHDPGGGGCSAELDSLVSSRL